MVVPLLETDSKFAKFFFSRCAWAYFDDKHWKCSPAANQASVIDNITDQFPNTYLTDGNKGSFKTQAIELMETLKDFFGCSLHEGLSQEVYNQY